MSEEKPGLTALGKILSFLIIAALIGLGVQIFRSKLKAPPTGRVGDGTTQVQPSEKADQPTAVVEALTETPRLPPSAAFVPKDNTVDIELSEYAGYSGLIVANG